jgi:hypothetical protein
LLHSAGRGGGEGDEEQVGVGSEGCRRRWELGGGGVEWEEEVGQSEEGLGVARVGATFKGLCVWGGGGVCCAGQGSTHAFPGLPAGPRLGRGTGRR